MWRRTMLPWATVAALALPAVAGAQSTSARPTYSDSQMQDFARATVDLQALETRDPASMTRAIEAEGMSVEDYNNMGDAMRADPALASSLNPYLDEANAEHRSRAASARRSAPVAHHAASAKNGATHHGKAHAGKGKAATKSSHTTRSTHKATAGKHKHRK